MREAFLKICGITRSADAVHAVGSGATAIGFVFWRQSPRWIDPDRAAAIVRDVPPGLTTVGVFVDESPEVIRRVAREVGLSAVQLHGDEMPSDARDLGVPVLRAIALDGFERARELWPAGTTWLLDAIDPTRRGGTGQQVDWGRAADVAVRARVILAGGLTPQNVADAIARVRPYGVDVSSGVEESPGVKDFVKVSRFLASAREAFARNVRQVTEDR
jgi:phosphoribosylanthranilate isomerase